jgi:hypothetical protein
VLDNPGTWISLTKIKMCMKERCFATRDLCMVADAWMHVLCARHIHVLYIVIFVRTANSNYGMNSAPLTFQALQAHGVTSCHLMSLPASRTVDWVPHAWWTFRKIYLKINSKFLWATGFSLQTHRALTHCVCFWCATEKSLMKYKSEDCFVRNKPWIV